MIVSGTAEALRALATPVDEAARATAWALLVERHGPDVWRVITSRCQPVESEDAYQDFWSDLPTVACSFRAAAGDGERSARAWLLRVAYTTALDERRRQRVRERRLGTGTVSTQEQAMEERPDHPLMERVQQVLAHLPEDQRRPLLLHVVGGLSYEELSADLRCTVNHARVKVHRALKRVRELLGTEGRDLPERTLAGLMMPPLLALPMITPVPPPVAAGALAGAGGISSGGIAATATTVTTKVMVSIGMAVVLAGAVGGAVVWRSPPSVVSVVQAQAKPAIVAPPALVVEPPPPRAEVAPPPPPKPATPSGPFDDFERAEAGLSANSETGGVTLSLAPVTRAGEEKKALRLTWPANHGRWMDATYAVQRAFPQVTAARSRALITLSSAQAAQLSDVSVRFTDAEGEIYQWRVPLPPVDSDGWYRVDIPLITTGTIEHWDGPSTANHHIDPPLTLRGYGFTFAEPGSGAGELLIDVVDLISDPP